MKPNITYAETCSCGAKFQTASRYSGADEASKWRKEHICTSRRFAHEPPSTKPDDTKEKP